MWIQKLELQTLLGHLVGTSFWACHSSDPLFPLLYHRGNNDFQKEN